MTLAKLPSGCLDLSGLHCPEVVLRVRAAITKLSSGENLQVISTDPLSAIDIPLFCRRTGHGCAVMAAHADGRHIFLLTRL